MDMLQLQTIYDTYVQTLAKVYREAKPTDGLFGWGDDPRKDPCHMHFYEQTEQWTGAFLASGPEQDAVFAAAKFILTFPAEHREEACFWFAFAAHGLTKGLISRLNTDQCEELWAFYEANYPKQERMPAQTEIAKLLKKGAGHRFPWGGKHL